MLLWQPFLAFYIWGAYWRHLKNTTEPFMCGGDAAFCYVTLTSGQSNITKGRIAAAHGSFNGIQQVAPV